VLLSASLALADDATEKDLTILRLKKIIAEQSLDRLLEYENVREYERIRANREKLLREIEDLEKRIKEGKTNEK
jgi:cell division protein FtsB